MTKKLGLLAALLAVVAAPSVGFSGTDTENVNIDAVFVQGISLTETASLNFGTTVLDGVAGGTLVIDPDASPLLFSSTGGSVITNIGATRAAFNVLTSPSVSYAIGLPVGTIAVGCNIGPCINPSVDVHSFTFFSSFTSVGGVNGGSGVSSPTGTDTLYVGATLDFLLDEEGDYLGTFNVVATYP